MFVFASKTLYVFTFEPPEVGAGKGGRPYVGCFVHEVVRETIFERTNLSETREGKQRSINIVYRYVE